jgi:catechol 2,3-dioxygenase-like lactoylglutathione lyase family enzyme
MGAGRASSLSQWGRSDSLDEVFDHVAIAVSDLAASERFYRTVLGALGLDPTHAGQDRIEWDDLHLVAATSERPPTRHLHVGFVAPSRQRVDDFWQAGVDAGYEDDGAPGERPQYTPGYYGAFLLDPDGNSAEAVRHDDVRRGGHIDHLWIRVRDLDASCAFFAAVMPHTGLREGRRWEQGRQFRGAWATFSLVDDGSAPTENLEIAFPAPDRETVDDFHRVALAIGCSDAGRPDARREHDTPVYGAAVVAPDGTRVESVLSHSS